MATRSGICLTCGTEENEENISGVTNILHNQESQKTTLPFDLQESNKRKLETPVFGLEASPGYHQKEKTVKNQLFWIIFHLESRMLQNPLFQEC